MKFVVHKQCSPIIQTMQYLFGSRRMIESYCTAGSIADVGSGFNGSSIHTKNCNDDKNTQKIFFRRASSCVIFILGLLGLYSFSVSKYLFDQQELSLRRYGENDAMLKHCIDTADGLWTPQENHWIHRPNTQKKNRSVDFRILCTSVDRRILWGSYKLRCNDFKRWVDVCAPNVDITVGVSIEKLHKLWATKPSERKDNNTSRVGSVISHNRMSEIDVFYNSTIFIKSMSKKEIPQFGKKFIDVVDEYSWEEERIPSNMHLILQTAWQGQSMYPNRTSSVVEHWYNSYPFDMMNSGYPEYVPSIDQKSSKRLHIATIWNTRRSHDPTEGGCPALHIPGVKYDCIDKVNFAL